MEMFTHTAVNYGKTMMGINVEEFGHSKTTPLRTFGPYWRDTFTLHFIVRGKGTFERQHRKVHLHAGQCFIIVPDERTSYTPDGIDPWEYYWICFKGTDAADMLSACGIDVSQPAMPFVFADIRPLVEFIDRYNSDYHRMTHVDVLRSSAALLQTLANIAAGNVEQSEQPKAHRNKLVETAIRYIGANYDKGINVTEISNMLYISRTYFSSIFTKEVGINPGNYLQKLRVNKAKLLMSDHPELSISDIAHAVGFDSPDRFSKVYARYELQSPSAYRKELKSFLSNDPPPRE
ncbi:MAG: AraC family transcriptional regulator [Clostridia bacterium]|nr:AraC family transcriptional regulator [Clostridia bacterium]